MTASNSKTPTTFSEILDQLHSHGDNCFCENSEKGLSATEALHAIATLIEDVIGERPTHNIWTRDVDRWEEQTKRLKQVLTKEESDG